MSNVIQIKRVAGSAPVVQLAAGELAFCDDKGGELYAGNIAVGANILVGAFDQARKTGATFTGTLELAPGAQTDPNDAATRSYVEGKVAGITEEKSSVAATTIPASPLSTLSPYGQTSPTILTETDNGAFPTIDGIAPALNKRYLLKDEALAKNNGIFDLTTVGDAGTKWVLTRAVDSDTAAENKRGQFCWIDAGTINTNSGWLQTSVDVVTLGTDNITFAQVSGQQLVLADETSLTKSGDTISIKAAGITAAKLNASVAGGGLNGGAGAALSVDCATGLEVAADAVKVSNQGVTETQLATSVAGGGLTGGGGAPLAVGAGTGMIISASKIAVDFGNTAGKALAGDAVIVGGTWV